MMNEFVREAYIAARESDTGVVSPHYGDEYDTWLRAHKRKIATRAWEEGWDACMGYVDGPDWGQAPLNPYLEGSNNDRPHALD